MVATGQYSNHLILIYELKRINLSHRTITHTSGYVMYNAFMMMKYVTIQILIQSNIIQFFNPLKILLTQDKTFLHRSSGSWCGKVEPSSKQHQENLTTISRTTSNSKNPQKKALRRGGFLEVGNEVQSFLWFLDSCKYHFDSLLHKIQRKSVSYLSKMILSTKHNPSL